MEDVADARRVGLAVAWLPPLFYASVIFAFSHIPAQRMPVPSEVWRVDKLIHLVEFALLGALLAVALVGRGVARRPAIVCATALASAWGILDELHQWYVPGRSSDPYDALADSVGAILGAALLGRLAWRSSVRSAA